MSLDRPIARPISTALARPMTGRAGEEDPLLDTYPGAEVALSLRKLRSGYSGACVRVRRSSDDAETNVGFSGDTIDEQELLDFANGRDVFVTKWFDQSGNGWHFDQTSVANQPKIVNSGSILTVNGNTYIKNGGFEAVDNVFSAANATDIVVHSLLIESNNFPQAKRLVGFNADAGSNTGQYIASRDADGKIGIIQEIVEGTNGVSVSDGNLHTLALVVNGNVEPVFYVDDMATQQSTVSQGANGSGSLTAIMARSDGARYWNAKGLEFVIYNNLDQNRRKAISDDHKDYYGP